MFKIILFLPLLLMACPTDLMAENEFYCKIDLLTREVSKDSNSQRYVVEVKGKSLSYEFNYSGFPENSNKSVSRTLTDEELSKIINTIKEEGINNPVIEIRPDAANGPSRKVHLSLVLTLDRQKSRSTIFGNYKINRADGQIEGEIIENKEYVDAVLSLIQGLN